MTGDDDKKRKEKRKLYILDFGLWEKFSIFSFVIHQGVVLFPRDIEPFHLFIVRADLASGRDFHLAADRVELSDFEFYCIFERIGARAEWSQARHLGHVTLGCVR